MQIDKNALLLFIFDNYVYLKGVYFFLTFQGHLKQRQQQNVKSVVMTKLYLTCSRVSIQIH